MGLTRQGVQKQVDLMCADGLLVVHQNPAHKRSPVIESTAKGARVHAQAMQRQEAWALNVSRGIATKNLEVAASVLERMRMQITGQDDGRTQPTAKEKGR